MLLHEEVKKHVRNGLYIIIFVCEKHRCTFHPFSENAKNRVLTLRNQCLRSINYAANNNNRIFDWIYLPNLLWVHDLRLLFCRVHQEIIEYALYAPVNVKHPNNALVTARVRTGSGHEMRKGEWKLEARTGIFRFICIRDETTNNMMCQKPLR